MLTQINDIEKLPKKIKINEESYHLFITVKNDLWIGYSDIRNYTPIIIAVVGFKEEIYDKLGFATTLEEAVNMLYEYVMNNSNIKVEQ